MLWIVTRIQQVGIFISKSFAGQEVVSISVERHERHHVVPIIMADGGISTWVACPGRLVSPEPALVDAELRNVSYVGINYNKVKSVFVVIHCL